MLFFKYIVGFIGFDALLKQIQSLHLPTSTYYSKTCLERPLPGDVQSPRSVAEVYMLCTHVVVPDRF